MKKAGFAERALASLLVPALVCALLISFAACEKSGEDSGSQDGALPPTEVVIDKEYKIIYDGTNERAGKAAARVQNALYRKYRLLLKICKDAEEPESKKEIIIGSTSRENGEENVTEFGSGGWSVYTKDEKCIILGATGTALSEAAEYFTDSLVKNEDGAVAFARVNAKTEHKTDALAALKLTLRVATFNIKNGSGVGHKMEKLAEHIAPLALDIVGLQEVDVGTSRAGGIDTLKELAEAAGFKYYAFSPAIDHRGGKYGHGIMSKYPIVSYETKLLTTPAEYEQRVYGHAVLDVGGEHIDFYNTHLSFENTDVRIAQFAELSAAIGNSRGFILTADFNTDDKSERKLIEGGVLVNVGEYATFPSKGTAIDDIILHGGWDILSSGMLESDGKSDHNLLWAEVYFAG